MSRFFRELATRALAPRGAVHPVSAAPYSPRAEAELPDAAVWPGAASPAARAGEPRATAARLTPPIHRQAERDDEDDVRFADREPEMPAVRAGKSELRVAREPAGELRATRHDSASDDSPETPAPASAAPATRHAPHVSTALRPAAIAVRAPAASAAPRMESRTDADTRSAPEVHIHIGRIELTAAATPVPAEKPRKSATRKTMSLDDYLQQRSRR